ncbi:hypothetical protein GQ55_8G091400 [Panicum hallii var. hallii]|uniref:Uncharacterized protein n=1 Tax=Panicum hallii var. hallii TaxID=1504633 RepID=A0A2T7CM56_9POAL|nr:hypothetical protein GQ55_8G091400 [Panicum hallii var. hallii]
MRLWMPTAWGFSARLSLISPQNSIRPIDTGKHSPSLVSIPSTPRARAGERRRCLPISSSDLATAASPPPTSQEQSNIRTWAGRSE